MLEAYRGYRPQTDAFSRFSITLGRAIQAANSPENLEWLEDQIRVHHGHLSFQTPDNIADAIRLVSAVSLWNEVAVQLSRTSQDTRERLRLIVNRRNQIAHESDVDPSYLNTRWPIDFAQVDDAVIFMENLVEAIHAVVV